MIICILEYQIYKFIIYNLNQFPFKINGELRFNLITNRNLPNSNN